MNILKRHNFRLGIIVFVGMNLFFINICGAVTPPKSPTMTPVPPIMFSDPPDSAITDTSLPPDSAITDISLVGSTVTLSGKGFGLFDGKIVTWDDFEAQQVGSFINGSTPKVGVNLSTQYGYNGLGAAWDNNISHSGSIAAHLDWSIDTNSIRAFGWANNGPFSKLYISYWRYMTGTYTAADGDNHKQFYLFGNGASDFPQMMPLIPAGSTSWGIYNNIGDGTVPYSERNNINTAGWRYDNTINKFQRWEFWFTLNDVNVPNGTVKAWVDGTLGIENYAYNSRRVDGEWDDFRLGHMAQGFTDTAEAWFDDLYIATTQARVEVCDSPDWTDRINCDIQVVYPEDWADDKIQFQLREDVPSSVTGKYLYIIDSTGDVIDLRGVAF